MSGDVYLVTYLGKPLSAHRNRQTAEEEKSSYSDYAQKLVAVVPVRLVEEGDV